MSWSVKGDGREGMGACTGPRGPPKGGDTRLSAGASPSHGRGMGPGASVAATICGEDGEISGAERFRRSLRNTVDNTFVKSPGLEPDLKIVIMLDLGASG